MIFSQHTFNVPWSHLKVKTYNSQVAGFTGLDFEYGIYDSVVKFVPTTIEPSMVFKDEYGVEYTEGEYVMDFYIQLVLPIRHTYLKSGVTTVAAMAQTPAVWDEFIGKTGTFLGQSALGTRQQILANNYIDYNNFDIDFDNVPVYDGLLPHATKPSGHFDGGWFENYDDNSQKFQYFCTSPTTFLQSPYDHNEITGGTPESRDITINVRMPQGETKFAPKFLTPVHYTDFATNPYKLLTYTVGYEPLPIPD